MTNLAQRIAVGVVAIPIIFWLCMAGGLYFFSFIAIVSAVALREFYALAEAKGARPLVTAGIIGGFFINFSFFDATETINQLRSHTPLVVVVLLVLVLVFSLLELFRNQGSALLNLSATLFGVLYISLCLGTLIGLRQLFVPAVFPVLRYFPGSIRVPPSATSFLIDGRIVDQIHSWGGYMLMSIFAVIWICDSAAFHVGSALGRHKLLPRVSPQKSWEGAVAGFAFAIASALAAKYLVLGFLPMPSAIVIGTIVGTVGQLGDLTESLMKRDAGVKDSSTLIPGHGGAFDRFDSVLLVAPCLYLYMGYVLLS